jgi:predicted PurR-regulated permease PerM
MEPPVLKFPPYVKLAFILLSLSIITVILYFGREILIPLLLALLFAILLRPVVIFLNKKLKFPQVLAIFVAITFFVVFVALIIFFITWQISGIADDWNKIKYNFSVHTEHIQHWIKQQYDVSYTKQRNYIDQVKQETLNGDSDLIGNTLSSFTDVVLDLILIPVYTFLILFYQNLFIEFLHKLVRQKNERTLIDVLVQVKTVIHGYIVGLLFEMAIITILTTTGLMLLGVPYAILLGIITALLNLIPYIGILVASCVTIMAALVNSTEVSVILAVIALSFIVQFIDNNIIVPRIVGNKVRINALVSVMGVIIGGSLWGISGMFIALPLIAIIKIIFDHIESLKPWGFLLGNNIPSTFKFTFAKQRKINHQKV